MPTFQSKPLKASPALQAVRRHPFLLFGLPFIGIIVGSSFALQSFTRTRYDLHAQKVQQVNWEQDMGMSKNRKKVDLKEEYYRLNNPAYASESGLDASAQPSMSMGGFGSVSGEEDEPKKKKKKKKFSMAFVPQDELENVRVERPEGVPEWGAPESIDAPIKGHRKEDRWV